MKYYKVIIKNEGSEITHGIISDPQEIQAMNNAIDDNDVVSSFMESEDNDGNMIDLFANDHNEIVGIYGPQIDGVPTFFIGEFTDDTFETEKNVLINFKPVDTVKYFSTGNPWFQDQDSYEDDALIWTTEKVEKRVNFECTLVLEDDEVFNLENLFIGTQNLDEIGIYKEIVELIYYIPESKQEELTKTIYGEDYDDNCELIDSLYEMHNEEEYFDNQIIIEKYLLELEEIEGKGEWESDYNRVKDMTGEVLYDEE